MINLSRMEQINKKKNLQFELLKIKEMKMMKKFK